MTTFAHIFQAPKHKGIKWQLMLTDGADLSNAKIKEQFYSNNKSELKQIARNLDAKPWNY